MLKERIQSVNDSPFLFSGREKDIPRRGKSRLFVSVYQINANGCIIDTWVPIIILDPNELVEHEKAKKDLESRR
jgi:hypothetical protein